MEKGKTTEHQSASPPGSIVYTSRPGEEMEKEMKGAEEPLATWSPVSPTSVIPSECVLDIDKVTPETPLMQGSGLDEKAKREDTCAANEDTEPEALAEVSPTREVDPDYGTKPEPHSVTEEETEQQSKAEVDPAGELEPHAGAKPEPDCVVEEETGRQEEAEVDSTPELELKPEVAEPEPHFRMKEETEPQAEVEDDTHPEASAAIEVKRGAKDQVKDGESDQELIDELRPFPTKEYAEPYEPVVELIEGPVSFEEVTLSYESLSLTHPAAKEAKESQNNCECNQCVIL